MNALRIAAQGKGPVRMLRRVGAICSRYGPTPRSMSRWVAQIVQLLQHLNCFGTFPVTTGPLTRNDRLVDYNRVLNAEFAVHGYFHIDHSRLPFQQQLAHLQRARRFFLKKGTPCHGFRAPYLRWNDDTLRAVREAGFLYDSSQALAWNVVEGLEPDSYHRALNFYRAIAASDFPALPRSQDGLVRIPYCLPDDEALVDRFHFTDAWPISGIWQSILAETHAAGELFTLGLHPERIGVCEVPLMQTIERARALSPAVWFARLDEIARWWMQRTEAVVSISQDKPGKYSVSVKGPEGLTVLARGVVVLTPAQPWGNRYACLSTIPFKVSSQIRPFIGVSPRSSAYLGSFLRQQGYIVERAASPGTHAYFLDRPDFGIEHERALLADIEQGDFPLVRLGRWPNGAQSALCVTGDIDAMTMWDYGLRFLGR